MIAVRANIKTLPPINLLPGKVVQVIGFYWGKGFEVLHHCVQPETKVNAPNILHLIDQKRLCDSVAVVN